MTVVGADDYLDAPVLEVGTSSAYTPNAGYGLQSGEPTAWGGKTAWWKVTPSEGAFLFIDVLYSTGSTRAWVYRSFVPEPTFAQLFLVSDPGADTQGGWSAAAGGTYWIRADSDGSDVSYVVSVGGYQYDTITERRFLHGPAPEDTTFPWNTRETYFVPGVTIASDPDSNAWSAHYYGLVDDNVGGAPGGTAFIHAGAFADQVVADYPSFNSGDWYTAMGGQQPRINFRTSSAGMDAVTVPDGYEAVAAPVYVTMASTDGPPIAAESDGDVPQVTLVGDIEPGGAMRYFDEFGSPAGDVEVGAVAAEYKFTLPVGFSPDTAVTDFNAGEIVFQVQPNLGGSTVNPQPAPVGTWLFYSVEIEFLLRSEEPLPYEPPPPPGPLTVVELYPREDGYGISGGLQLYPEPKSERIYGGRI